MSEITVYLLHFRARVGRSQHYIGSCETRHFKKRMRAHARGYGAALTRHAARAGISFEIARLWSRPSRDFEYELKARGHASTLCPICSPELPLPPIAKPPGCEAEGLAIPHFCPYGWKR
jgi:predicted GIY-YIG superfamily endonuclease